MVSNAMWARWDQTLTSEPGRRVRSPSCPSVVFDPIAPSTLARVPVETREVTTARETKGGGRGERGGVGGCHGHDRWGHRSGGKGGEKGSPTTASRRVS